MTHSQVRVRRVYDEPADRDGIRVLVDRIWPRGVTKAEADLGHWCREVAPSTALRKWYGHDASRFEEFSRRYRAELELPGQGESLRHLRELAAGGHPLTLLTASRHPDISQAAVLAELLRD